MSFKKGYTSLLILALTTSSYAGFNGVTHHSRANCAVNESISWDWSADWDFWVNSQHIHAKSGSIVHTLVSQWQKTWRNAMVHWGEGTGGWVVHGMHWMIHWRTGVPTLAGEETVNDCSIYDGWWDVNR